MTSETRKSLEKECWDFLSELMKAQVFQIIAIQTLEKGNESDIALARSMIGMSELELRKIAAKLVAGEC